jgi:predicted metal-binding membrane protein
MGALKMGVNHGAFCVGCCWALMALLFVVGVMNLLWVAIIAAFVLVEKLAQRGAVVGRAAGALLIVWAVFEFTRI